MRRQTAIAVLVVLLATLARPVTVHAESNLTTIINGVLTNLGAASFYDGNTGPNNTLIVTNAGIIMSN